MRYILLISLFAITGCQLSLSSDREGLWVNREERNNACNNWSIKLALRQGKFVRPIKGEDNPWQGGEPRDVWYSDWIVLPFVSVGIGDYGFYLGGKWFDYHKEHEERYFWFPYDETGSYLTLSSRMTTNRCDK